MFETANNRKRIMEYPSDTLAFRLVRAPGERDLILRCSGELSGATAEVLRRELTLLSSLNPIPASCDAISHLLHGLESAATPLEGIA
jgi:hypothetical protein